MPITLEPYKPFQNTTTGLSPSKVTHSRVIHLLWRRFKLGPHHIYFSFQRRIQFALFGFRSPLLTESRLISFPAGTKMFQFPAFPLLSEQLGNPRIKGCLRLPEAYHSLPCPSSAIKPSHPLYDLLTHFLWRIIHARSHLCLILTFDPSSIILQL